MSDTNILAKILNQYRSLIEMAPKVPAKDKESLSLVYTPGVAEACNIIKEHPEESYNLTNRGNSIIILTDGTGLSGGDAKNYQFLPYLETLAVFYKQIANVDAYPLLLDRDRTDTPEKIYEVLDNLTPGFVGYELYGIEKSRVQQVETLTSEKPINSLLLNPNLKARIEQNLGLENAPVKSHTLVASVIRAALDCRVYKNLPEEFVSQFTDAISKKKELLQKDNFYELAKQAVFEAATILTSLKLNTDKEVEPEDVRRKLARYYLEGSQSWEKHTDFDYLDERHPYKANAVELHRVHVGVTNVKPKLCFRDISSFEHLFKKENLEEVRDYILQDPPVKAYDVTLKNNLCAIITNGTAILGLGDIGPTAGMPVMEGKSVLFKQLAGVDVMPIGIKEKDTQKAVDLIARFGHTFAAINLEDIKAPACFFIEKGLQEVLDIPVFHDDQHGTAVVAVAAFLNAIKLAKKKVEDVKLIINGGGAAGVAIAELLLEAGCKKIVVCDTKGAIYEGRTNNMNEEKEKLAKITNKEKEQGTLEEVLKGADVFLGVSVGGALKKEMIKVMNEKPIIFAFANPEPEIMPDEAKDAGALVVATGRSDFANQVNNSLVFPGIFRGAIDIRASKISVGMQMAATHAIANLIKDRELNPEYIIPGALDFQVPLAVASSVVETGTKEGVAIREIDLELYKEHFKYFVLHGQFNQYKSLSKNKEGKIKQ